MDSNIGVGLYRGVHNRILKKSHVVPSILNGTEMAQWQTIIFMVFFK